MEIVYVLSLTGSKGCKYSIPVKEAGFGKVLSLSVDEVEDLPSFTKGYFQGVLAAKGQHLKSVISQPADSLCCVNTIGQPVFVFSDGLNYEFHCFFATQVDTLQQGVRYEEIQVN